MQWYYSKNASQVGPVPLEELRAKLTSGEVSGTDMVWTEGMADWKPASTVPELVVPQPGPSAPPVSGGVEGSPYSPPAAAPASLQLSGAPVPNYLWQSIVVTILCCWPLGIPAIVYAAKVDGLVARGDVPGAMAASANARKWCWIAVGSWGVLIVIYMIFAVVALVSGGITGHH